MTAWKPVSAQEAVSDRKALPRKHMERNSESCRRGQQLQKTLLLLLLTAGCESSSDLAANLPLEKLPRTMARQDPQLRQELNALQQRGQLPWQWPTDSILPENNAAVLLLELFENQDVETLAADAAMVLPPAGGAYSLTDLEFAAASLEQHAQDLHRIQQAVRRPACSFGVDPSQGLLANLDFIPRVRLAVRLHAFQAAQFIGEMDRIVEAQRAAEPRGEPIAVAPAVEDVPQRKRDPLDDAVNAIGDMLQWSAWLAREPHPVCRIEAVFLRGEACRVMEQVAQHRALNQDHVRRLHAVATNVTQDWTSDADIARLDRIMGLQVYELIRAGAFDIVFSPDDAGQEQTALLRRVRRLKPEEIDRDQVFFLQCMHSLVQRSLESFPVRQRLFVEWRGDAEKRREQGEYPTIALDVALRDARRLHQLLTFDRARSEAWAVALAAAAGEPRPPFTTSPLTGEEYRLTERDDRIAVWGHGSLPDEPQRPIVVRRLATPGNP